MTPSVLFVGIGTTAPAWYRCALPARALGHDWLGVLGEPSDLAFRTGELRHASVRSIEDFAAYDVVVLQQPRGTRWLAAIRDLQRSGTRVLFEIDDYVHGVRKADHHGSAHAFTKEAVKSVELCMRACDGIVVSTDYLAARYRSFNRNVWVCRNGLDLGRYALTAMRAQSHLVKSDQVTFDQVTVGWAGGTGHRPALVPWLRELLAVLEQRPHTRFMSIGAEDYAAALAERFGPERCRHLPWGAIETYPAAMCHLDIALAPAAPSAFFKGKSDLRWLEASALGIPTIADPDIYPGIEHGVTGLHAATPGQFRVAVEALIADRELRDSLGAAAREHVTTHRSIQRMAPAWTAAFDAVTASPVAA